MKFPFLRSLFFPPRCCGCDRLLRNSGPFCYNCRELVILPSDKKSACDVCGTELSRCLCIRHQYFKKLSAVFLHEGSAKRTVLKMKFSTRPDIAASIAKGMKIQLDRRDILSQTDIITFIPMCFYDKLKRGYNQSELIAKKLSELSGIECMPLLEKTYRTKKQHRLKKIQRSGNVIGTFEPVKENIPAIEGKRILIADDVLTTGSTMNEAAKTLLIFGAEEIFVSSFTVAKKQLNEKK